MKLVYVAHPVAGDVAANLARARRWLRWIYREFPEVAPIAPWIVDCEVLDDADPADRARGMATDAAVVARVDEVWLVGGRVSEGMRREAAVAQAAGVKVVDKTAMGAEAPGVRAGVRHATPPPRMDPPEWPVATDADSEDP